jgi:hypothetical protein
MAIKSRAITPGDPVTAEIINNLIIDLGAIEAKSTAQSIILQNAQEEGKKDQVTTMIWNSAPISINVESGTPKAKEFKFGNQKWASPPAVWVQFYIEGISQPTWAKSQIFTQVSKVTTTSAFVLFRSATASTIKVIVFATGVPATA